MITKKQAYEAAMTLSKYCDETGYACDTCPFKNFEDDCLLNGIPPELWSECIDIDRFLEG